MKKIYLLWRVDPHHEDTDVIGVYSTLKLAKINQKKAIEQTKEIKSSTSESWFSYDIDEMEVDGFYKLYKS